MTARIGCQGIGNRAAALPPREERLGKRDQETEAAAAGPPREETIGDEGGLERKNYDSKQRIRRYF